MGFRVSGFKDLGFKDLGIQGFRVGVSGSRAAVNEGT